MPRRREPDFGSARAIAAALAGAWRAAPPEPSLTAADMAAAAPFLLTTGSGVSEQEREAVLRRFYRSDKIRNTPGVGLGLNLVAAIVKLHGFRLAIHPGPGCRVEIICPDREAAKRPARPATGQAVC